MVKEAKMEEEESPMDNINTLKDSARKFEQ
jgi:hypothetical protein